MDIVKKIIKYRLKTNCHDGKRQKAFTLVELMVVLAILSILVSIAIPSYNSVIQKGQRVEGQTLLLEIQGQMERFYFNNQHYPDRLSKLNVYQTDELDSESGYYQVGIESPSQACPANHCYLITATHRSGDQQEALSIYSNGDKEGPW